MRIQPLLWVRVQPEWTMMGLKAPLGTSTYLTAITRRTRPVDDWALCCVADSLQNRSFPGICSSNDEHSESDVWGAGTGRWGRRWSRRRGWTQTTNKLLCTHSTKVLREERRDVLLITRCNPALVIIHTVQTSADWCACRGMPFHFTD